MKKIDITWKEKQEYLFKLIKNKIDKNQNFTDVLGDALGISDDAVYRRVSGKTDISAKELDALCRKFNISVDKILNYDCSEDISFKYLTVVPDSSDSYIQYLQQLYEILMKLTQSSGNSEFIFTSCNIPFYYFPYYPELFYFKLYERYSKLNGTNVSYNDFCKQLDKDLIMPRYKQIVKTYMELPSKEVWSINTISRTLQSLKYCIETKCFDNKATELLLLQQLSELMHTIEKNADEGIRQDKQTPFEMYICPLDIPYNIMIIRNGDKFNCDIRLFTANSFFIDNERVCLDIYKEVKSLISKSMLVSIGLKHERCEFFQTLQNKIAELIVEIA